MCNLFFNEVLFIVSWFILVTEYCIQIYVAERYSPPKSPNGRWWKLTTNDIQWLLFSSQNRSAHLSKLVIHVRTAPTLTWGAWEQPPRGAPWISCLIGHFVQTWPDSELLSHRVVLILDCSDLNWRCNHYHLFWHCMTLLALMCR